jgi:hypothetical protein
MVSKYEEGYNEGYKDKHEEGSLWSGVIGLFIGMILLSIILLCCGVFDPAFNKLDLDEDKLSEYHVLKYYPEYENCSIIYDSDLKSDCNSCPIVQGVSIYCEEKDDRDGMKIHRERTATIEIEFSKITLEDIFEDILQQYK